MPQDEFTIRFLRRSDYGRGADSERGRRIRRRAAGGRLKDDVVVRRDFCGNRLVEGRNRCGTDSVLAGIEEVLLLLSGQLGHERLRLRAVSFPNLVVVAGKRYRSQDGND